MKDLASLCMRLAVWLIDRHDNEWAQAMRAELDHVQTRDRLSWALGCLISAVRRRFAVMRTGTLQVSRGVLLLELLVCFLPITLGWWDAVFGGSGILQLNHAVIEQHFLGTPLGISVLFMIIGAAVIGLVGPIGLFLTSRAVMTGKGLHSRPLGVVMIAAVACFAAASIILRLLSGPGAYAATADFILLVCVLPAAGIALSCI